MDRAERLQRAREARTGTALTTAPAEAADQPKRKRKPDKRERLRRLRHGKRVTVPARFVPKFWNDIDGNSRLAKQIKKRIDQLTLDAGVESYQQGILVEQVVWLLMQVETLRMQGIEAGDICANLRAEERLVTRIQSILKDLGLKKAQTDSLDLDTYLAGNDKH